MNAQSELNKIVGAATSGVSTAIDVSKKFGNTDKKMADKARQILKEKITVSKSNKEIYAKTRTKLDVKTEDLIGGSK